MSIKFTQSKTLTLEEQRILDKIFGKVIEPVTDSDLSTLFDIYPHLIGDQAQIVKRWLNMRFKKGAKVWVELRVREVQGGSDYADKNCLVLDGPRTNNCIEVPFDLVRKYFPDPQEQLEEKIIKDYRVPRRLLRRLLDFYQHKTLEPVQVDLTKAGLSKKEVENLESAIKELKQPKIIQKFNKIKEQLLSRHFENDEEMLDEYFKLRTELESEFVDAKKNAEKAGQNALKGIRFYQENKVNLNPLYKSAYVAPKEMPIHRIELANRIRAYDRNPTEQNYQNLENYKRYLGIYEDDSVDDEI